ncbi:MAG: hypothetical protein V4482_04705 [Pseudomonadota bacterium]
MKNKINKALLQASFLAISMGFPAFSMDPASLALDPSLSSNIDDSAATSDIAHSLPLREQQEITRVSALMESQSNTELKARTLYYALIDAAKNKQYHVLDALLLLNFESNPSMLFNKSIVGIAGILAVQGDLEGVTRILNAKRTAFEKFGRADEEFTIEIAELFEPVETVEIWNKVLSVSAYAGNAAFIRRILERPDALKFDRNGINWALRNAVFAGKKDVIPLLFTQTYLRPDIEGLIDALEVSFNEEHAPCVSAILDSAVNSNEYTFSQILLAVPLYIQEQIVCKYVRMGEQCPVALIPGQQAKLCAMISAWANGREKVTHELQRFFLAMSAGYADTVFDRTIKIAAELTDMANKRLGLEGLALNQMQYLNHKHSFLDYMLSFFSQKLPPYLRLSAAARDRVQGHVNALLITSASFGDYALGDVLLDPAYNFEFTAAVIQQALSKFNSKVQTPIQPQKKIKREKAANASAVEQLSESERFVKLLQDRLV